MWGPDSISTEESIIQLQVQCDGAICLDNSPQVSFQNTRVHFLHGFSFNREFLSLKCSTNLKTVKNAREICEACLQAHRAPGKCCSSAPWLTCLTDQNSFVTGTWLLRMGVLPQLIDCSDFHLSWARTPWV